MIFRIAFSILLIVLISGCSSSYKQLSNKNFSSQDPFIQTIINEYKKKADFIDISETTYLLSDNSKLKKIIKFKINSHLKKMIF